jgi:hypothetical protein
MVKMVTMEEAAEIAGKTMVDFYDWIEGGDLNERDTIDDYVLNVCFLQKELACVYTDGTGGVLVLTGYGEYFDEKGTHLHAVEGQRWCEISFATFSEIMREMEWYQSLFWKDLEEEEDEEEAA